MEVEHHSCQSLVDVQNPRWLHHDHIRHEAWEVPAHWE
jgi:hypothetical protein